MAECLLRIVKVWSGVATSHLDRSPRASSGVHTPPFVECEDAGWHAHLVEHEPNRHDDAAQAYVRTQTLADPGKFPDDIERPVLVRVENFRGYLVNVGRSADREEKDKNKRLEIKQSRHVCCCCI